MEQKKFEAYLRSFQPEVPKQLQKKLFGPRSNRPWIIYASSIAASVVIAVSALLFYMRPHLQAPAASPLAFTAAKKHSVGYWRLKILNDSEVEALKATSATIFHSDHKETQHFTIRRNL